MNPFHELRIHADGLAFAVDQDPKFFAAIAQYVKRLKDISAIPPSDLTQVFLHNELGLQVLTYESESRVGESIVPVLESMLAQAAFAVLVLTAEDETAKGDRRARQNVVHEAGLFQGRLGFKRAVLLVQEGLEEFTNVAGLQHIRFSAENIEQTFYELQRPEA